MTPDEFLALPPDDSKTQLIDGEFVVTEVRIEHNRIALTTPLIPGFEIDVTSLFDR